MMNRRGLLLGLIAAPAIVKASSLMPVKPRLIWTSDLIVNPIMNQAWLEGWVTVDYARRFPDLFVPDGGRDTFMLGYPPEPMAVLSGLIAA